MAALMTAGACKGPTVGLAPDLSFWVDCPRLADTDQIKLEENLYSAGFDVLNKSRLARQTQADYPFPVDINAMDRRGFIFEMSVLPPEIAHSPSRGVSAAVGLYSAPPTRHDEKLEQAILTMTTTGIGCTAQRLQRNDNRADSGEMYRKVASTNQGWFAQARAAAPRSNALHLH